jgi:Protein of unknown function (DUF1573)
MKFPIICAGLALLCSYACKNDVKSATDMVQTVQKPEGENASMVHNSVSATVSSDTVNVAKMTFETSQYEYGTVKEGVVVKYDFKFKNTGRVPLLISDCRSSCGCTVPDWPKDPIPVGGSGVISAKFNTEGKQAHQRKEITISANTNPSSSVVALSGEVAPKKK